MDQFERLGFPRQFTLNTADLEQAYLTRSRAIHPDYHQLEGDSQQAASVEASAALNEAYTTLRDPFKRANYMLELLNGPMASDLKEMPASFLNEMLELRMEIAELKPETPQALTMEKQLASRREKLLDQVGQALTANNLPEARRLLNATKYVQNLLRDLRQL
jgi:molecular chaperone HscB